MNPEALQKRITETAPDIGDIITTLWEMISKVSEQFVYVLDREGIPYKNVFPPESQKIRPAESLKNIIDRYKPSFDFNESSMPQDYWSQVNKQSPKGHRYKPPREIGRGDYAEKYGNVTYTDWTTGLKKAVIEDMDSVAKDIGSQFRVDWTISGAHVYEKGKKSRHYSGRGVDLNYVDGQSIESLYKTNPWKVKAIMDKMQSLHPGMEVLGPGDDKHGNHIHVGWPKGV